jgi:hypothetical protein
MYRIHVVLYTAMDAIRFDARKGGKLWQVVCGQLRCTLLWGDLQRHALRRPGHKRCCDEPQHTCVVLHVIYHLQWHAEASLCLQRDEKASRGRQQSLQGFGCLLDAFGAYLQPAGVAQRGCRSIRVPHLLLWIHTDGATSTDVCCLGNKSLIYPEEVV